MEVSTVVGGERDGLGELYPPAAWGRLTLQGSVETIVNVPALPFLADQYWKVWGASVGVLIQSNVFKIGHVGVLRVVLEPCHDLHLVSLAFDGPDGNQVCVDVFHSIMRCCDFLDGRLKEGIAWLVLAPIPGHYGNSEVTSATLGLDPVDAWKL